MLWAWVTRRDNHHSYVVYRLAKKSSSHKYIHILVVNHSSRARLPFFKIGVGFLILGFMPWTVSSIRTGVTLSALVSPAPPYPAVGIDIR